MDLTAAVLMLGAHVCCLLAFISTSISITSTNYITLCGIALGTTSIYLYNGDNIEFFISYIFIMLSFLYISFIED